MFSDSEGEFEDDLAFLFLNEYLRVTKKQKRKNRRYWVHDVNKERENVGEYHTLLQRLECDDDRFFMYFRMYKVQFEEIHSIIECDIKKEHNKFRKPISTKERLAVCLR
jgi:hypothetical protein